MKDKSYKLWFTVGVMFPLGRAWEKIFVSLSWFREYVKEILGFELSPEH
ncbi:MAG: hypothetical protein QXX56_00030 [Candidatus Bathyarchaeia archaeon]